MKIVENDQIVLSSCRFSDIKELDKFATIANNRIVVWRKIKDKLDYLIGDDPDDYYTCPQPNAVTDTGFPACFKPYADVFKVASTEYNDSVKLRS